MNAKLDGWRHGQKVRKCLIVDDSLVTRKLLKRAFERANYIVDTAKNGQIGVEKMKQSIYDVVFMDLDMPVMDGLEATRELRRWEDVRRPGARQPICALTGSNLNDTEKARLIELKAAGETHFHRGSEATEARAKRVQRPRVPTQLSSHYS